MNQGRSTNLPRTAPIDTLVQGPTVVIAADDEEGAVAVLSGNGRPLSARMSDRPGGALSGVRPRSFSRVRAGQRPRVASYREVEDSDDENMHLQEGRTSSSRDHDGDDSYGIRENGSGSLLGIGRSARVTNNERGDFTASRNGGGGLKGSARGFLNGGSRGLGSPGTSAVDTQRRSTALGHSHHSIGTKLHALDDSRHDDSRHASPDPVNGVDLANSGNSRGFGVGRIVGATRRSAGSGPVRSSTRGAASGFDSPTDSRDSGGAMGPAGAGGGFNPPTRRASTNSLGMMEHSHGTNDQFDNVQDRMDHESVLTMGTPISRGVSRAKSTRAVVESSSSRHAAGGPSSRSRGGGGFARRGSTNALMNGNRGTPGAVRNRPKNFREAIETGDVLAVGGFVRAMSPEEAEKELLKQDRENGSPLMQAAAGKSVQTYRAVMDAIRSRLGEDALVHELQAKDLREWGPLMHASWSGSTDVFRSVVSAIEDHLGRDQVKDQLSATAKYGWTPLHAAAHGNEALGAVMTALVNYMEADELKEQLSQSHDKDSDLPTPLMFAAASSSLDAKSLSPLLTELLGCMCDIDEIRRQRTAVDYSASRGRLDILSCLIAYGCEINDQTVSTLLAGDLAVGAKAFNGCIWKGITTARNPLIPAHNVLRAVGRAADRDAKYRQFLLRMQSDVEELVHELLQQLPPNMAGFSDNNMDTGQGFASVQWMLEPEMAGKRIATFTGPLARALETSRLSFFSTDLILAYVSRKFSRGLPGVFSGASWRMPDMHNPDTKRFVLSLPYGAAPDNVVGAVRMRVCVPFELVQGSALRRTSLLPGLQFNAVGLASRPDAFYEVPAVRMAFDVVTYLSMLVLFCFVVKLDSPDEIPEKEFAFYAYMLGTMVNELGEARYLRKLRGQSELWNVVEAILLGLICAAFTARIIALENDRVKEEAFFLAQLFLSIATPLLFSRVLFLAQIDKNLGLMVQVLFRMLKEVVRFGVVIAVVLLGFATAMYALFGGEPELATASSSSDSERRGIQDDDTIGELSFQPFGRLMQSAEETMSTLDPSTFIISEVYLPNFTTFTESALTLFRAMFGDFDFDEFSNIRYGAAGVGLMVAFLTIMVITLLNLLIAFLTAAHSDVQKNAQAKFHFSRTQIVQHWDRVVEHDVLPAPMNLVHRSLCLMLRVFVSRQRYPHVQMRIGCFLFWLVMGPLGAVIAIAIWLISLPWSFYMLFVGGQAGKEVDRKSERLKYMITAPGLVMIALLLGFLTIFVGDGSSDGARGRGKSTRNSRKDKLQRGGDFDVAGLLKKMAKIGVDDLRRQLKNPLKEMQVLPRDAKLGTTVEHVKQLRDDITSTTAQTVKDATKAVTKSADERASRLEVRISALEVSLAKVTSLLEAVVNRGAAPPLNAHVGGAEAIVTESTVSGSRSLGSQVGSHTSHASQS